METVDLFKHLGGDIVDYEDAITDACEELELDPHNEKHRELAADDIEDESNLIYYMFEGHVPPYLDILETGTIATLVVKDTLTRIELPHDLTEPLPKRESKHATTIKERYPDVKMTWMLIE